MIAVAGLCMLSLHMTANAADLSDWAVNEYIESNSTGLLSYSIVSGDLRSNITREEFCELAINLYKKLTNEELKVPSKSPFIDCDNVAVSQAYYNGIVKGVSENEFEPDRAVTRQEMAVMLVNTLNAGEVDVVFNTGETEEAIEKFDDHELVSDWARPALTTLVNHALLSGNDDNEIMPTSNTTREQAMSCINRSYKTFSGEGQERYMLPILLSPTNGKVSGDITVSWGEVEGAEGFYVIIKDDNSQLAYQSEVPEGSYVEIIPESQLKDGKYSVVIGAKMYTGDTVFGLPIDFEVGKEPVVEEEPPKQDVIKPIIDYSGEVLTDQAKAILAEADKYLGIKYVYGGTTPSGFDCSGFVKYVFANCGITLKRVSRDQYANNGVSVAREDLQPGDLVFFGSNGYVSHVGIYAGGGQMIHSPSTGKVICYTSINSNYYLSHYIGAKRVLN